MPFLTPVILSGLGAGYRSRTNLYFLCFRITGSTYPNTCDLFDILVLCSGCGSQITLKWDFNVLHHNIFVCPYLSKCIPSFHSWSSRLISPVDTEENISWCKYDKLFFFNLIGYKLNVLGAVRAFRSRFIHIKVNDCKTYSMLKFMLDNSLVFVAHLIYLTTKSFHNIIRSSPKARGM